MDKSDKEWAPIFDEGNRIIGEISTLWGEIDWTLFLIFEELLGIDQGLAWPVFFSHRNSRSRTDMLLALANAKWDGDIRLDRLNKLTRHRTDISTAMPLDFCLIAHAAQ